MNTNFFFRECPPRPVDVSPEVEARNNSADPSANPSVTSCPAPTTDVSDNLPPPPSDVLLSPVPPTRTKRGGMSPLLKKKRVGVICEEKEDKSCIKEGGEVKDGGGETGGRLGEATQVQQVNGGVSDPPQRR